MQTSSGTPDTTTPSTPSLAFQPSTGADPVSTVDSQPVTLSGFGRPETASIVADSATWMKLPPTLVRNGAAVGATTTVQDGDTLGIEAASVPANGAPTRAITVQVGAVTATWTITTRSPDIGAYAGATPGTGGAVESNGFFYAVPFTPLRDFAPHYAGIMVEVGPAVFEFQPRPASTAIYSDAQGVPGNQMVIGTTTESRWPTIYLGSASQTVTFPVLGGGTFSLDNRYVPEADFGRGAPTLKAGTRYWLVVQYATSLDQRMSGQVGTSAFALGGDPVPSGGPTALQSDDRVAWREWGRLYDAQSGWSPGKPYGGEAGLIIPEFFVSD